MELQEIQEHGKSTICEEFLKITNSKLIDADKIAKSLDYPESKYLKEIENLFGREVINIDGTLNRKKLGDIIYNNLKKKNELDKITFKYVVKETEKELEKLSKENIDYILIDAPLLFEAKIDKKCDYVISVTANKQEKINRILARDNLTEEIANNRLSVQKDDDFFKLNSDFIIENNGTKKEIREKVERILGILHEGRRI